MNRSPFLDGLAPELMLLCELGFASCDPDDRALLHASLQDPGFAAAASGALRALAGSCACTTALWAAFAYDTGTPATDRDATALALELADALDAGEFLGWI